MFPDAPVAAGVSKPTLLVPEDHFLIEFTTSWVGEGAHPTHIAQVTSVARRNEGDGREPIPKLHK